MGDVTTMDMRGITEPTAPAPAPAQAQAQVQAQGPAPGPTRRRTELAAFLRSRRARVTPADVGMPPGPRRRTPGLRREEVAQLSGVGVTWYTWLEQGRPINASAQVLDAVARTLRLDKAECEHLYQLAQVPYVARHQAAATVVGQEIQGILDALDPHPAVVYNSRYDILATNVAYTHLFFVPEVAAIGVANVLWTLFVVPEPDCPLVFRDSELPVMVATLRGAYGRHVGEPAWEDFVRELSAASPMFARLWASGDVVPPGPRVKTFRHKAVGELRMTSVSLSINGMPECRIVAYTPDDEDTRTRMERLRQSAAACAVNWEKAMRYEEDVPHET
ncbi:helix-turn-helix transcriptional regulator [Streptomyces silvensis]|uniref:XRE family transcriptional regulator n=1 Tax=Streptomyces silvensis TaxID=1765722 RepID=A0A0W7XBU6_9ACTN|nr:helix-turn-helix transcriptional regulator [Streptomyces silvensis]KUF20279.1 XRE family transcriptional regulator [Streptomyces silvensis]